MKNYIRLGLSVDEESVHYVFCDTEGFLAERLLRERDVQYEFGDMLSKPGEVYRMVAVAVWKDDEELFLRAMEDLRSVMKFSGFRDYDSHCGKMIAELEAMVRADAARTGLVPLPTGGYIPAPDEWKTGN